MTSRLGVDLGTTYTAAAIARDGRVEMLGLSDRGPVIPSVVCLRADGSVLVGADAERRAASEPDRVAREFKRRIGDSAPLLVGGTPIGAEALQAELLEYVVKRATSLEGGPPDDLVVTHPANWGPYKRELLVETIREADLDPDTVRTLTEPEAAAIHYGSQERVEAGSIVAVYDLGGGTFDAAVLRRNEDGYEILGRPTGIERLGGIDFDEAIFEHVRSQLDAGARSDDDDLETRAAWAALRRECVAAKEALASATDTEVHVALPGLSTDVRLTRSEFEDMIRPAVARTTESLERAIQTAGITPDQLTSVLLVGGSSRIPLVGQQITEALGRPVAVDAHPKYAIAKGAALSTPAASPAASPSLPPTTPMSPKPPSGPPPGSFGVEPIAAPASPPPAPTPAPSVTASTPTEIPSTTAPVGADPTAVMPAAAVGPPTAPPPPPAPPTSMAASPTGEPTGPSSGKMPLVLGAVAAVGLLIGGFFVFGGGDDGGGDADVSSSSEISVPEVDGDRPEVSIPEIDPGGDSSSEVTATNAGLSLPLQMTWSHIEFEVNEAIFSNADPTDFGKPAGEEIDVVDEDVLYLAIDMDYEASYPAQNDSVETNQFSLRLADDEVVAAGPVQFATKFFINTGANDTIRLAFEVTPAQLEGATLVLDDRVTVPAEVGLDGVAADEEYPIVLPVGESVEVTLDGKCLGTTTISDVSWDVDAGVDHNAKPIDSTEPRARAGSRWLRVTAQTVAGPDCSILNVFDDDYALEIDGLPVFSASTVNELLNAGQGVELILGFEVELDTEVLELNLGSPGGTRGIVEVPRPDEFP